MEMTTMKLPCKPLEYLNDQAVLDQIPSDVLAMLGNEEGSGFNLDTSIRDLFFSQGVIRYKGDDTTITIEFDPQKPND